MLVAGVAVWRVWRAEGGALPQAVAGHSLGEYSALVAAGVLTLAQAAPLVRLRAAAMQEAVPVHAESALGNPYLRNAVEQSRIELYAA